MAIVEGQNIPEEVRASFFDALQFDYQNGATKVILKNRTTGRVRARAIASRSSFKVFSPLWRALGIDDRTTWAPYPAFFNARYFARFVQNNNNRWKLFMPTTSEADSAPGFCGFYQKLATGSTTSLVFEIADGATKRTEYRTTRKYYKPEVKRINHATDIGASLLFFCKNVTHSGDARIRVRFSRTYRTEEAETGEDVNEVYLTIGVGGQTQYNALPFQSFPARYETLGLRMEIKLAGHAGDFIFGGARMSVYNDGVTYDLNNTPRMADVGASYSGKYRNVEPDWNAESMGSGDTFASALPAYYGYEQF